MDYLCTKFGDFTVNRFGYYRADRISLTDRQTDRQTVIEADQRYPHATTIYDCLVDVRNWFYKGTSTVSFVLYV